MDFCQNPSNCIWSRLATSEPFGKFHPFVKIFFVYYLIACDLKFEDYTEEDGTIGEETLPCPMGQGPLSYRTGGCPMGQGTLSYGTG